MLPSPRQGRSPAPPEVREPLRRVIGKSFAPHGPKVRQRPVDLRERDNFRAASELVTTAVTVRDGDGRLITNLEQKDFTIEEDGVAQPITQFTKERVPVSLSLTLDISDSMRGQRMSMRAAPSRISSTSCWRSKTKRRCSASTTKRACSASGRPTAPVCGRSSTTSGHQAAPPSTTRSMRPCRCSSRASIRARRCCSCPTARDTASDVTPAALKQKLVRSDVFLYAIGIDSLDARNSTRINPFTLNELTSQSGGYTEIIRQHGGPWSGHRADR